MGFKIVEHEPTPHEVYNIRIYLTAVVISFGGLLFGYTSSFIGTTISLPAFKKAFDVTSSATSADIVSVFQAGAFFGCITTFPLMERFGRKWILTGIAILFELSAILQVAASNQIGLIYAGRVLGGLSVGGVTTVAPVYLAELSPPAIRGRLVGFYEIAYQLAAVVGFWLNYGIEQHMDPAANSTWKIGFAIQLIPGGMLLLGSIFLKESPRYLLKMSKPELATKNLSWLRNLPASHPYIENELSATVVQINRERGVLEGHKGNGFTRYCRGMWSEVTKKGIRNRLIIGAFIMMWQNMSGINAINYYSPTLFKQIGIQDVLLYTGIFGVLKALASVVFFIFLVDTLGRRPPLMFGAVTSGFCLLYVGLFIKIGHPETVTIATASTVAGGKAATAFILLFGVFYCLGWNGLAWVICAEIYPARIRGLCAMWTACWQWIFQFIIARTTPAMSQHLGYGMFILFFSFNIASAFFSYFFIPETKGRSLEDMDSIFGFQHADELKQPGQVEMVEDSKKGLRELHETAGDERV